jgi:uncharacterized membrane protein (UPF0127 family)
VVSPWRTARAKGAKSVLELAAGECERRNLEVGDRLELAHEKRPAGAALTVELAP